jgi:thioesterase domain-containing protein
MIAHKTLKADRPTAADPEADEVFVFPATVGQQGFWYLDLLRPGNPAYNIAVRFRLQGRLRVEELERALNEIVRRHESLRTTFAIVEDVPVQVVSPRQTLRLWQDDLRGGPEDERAARARAVAIEEGRLPFDLTRGPLIRARLLRLDDEDHTLLVTVHHIVADGWSVGVMTQELGALYDAYCRGLDSPLAELPIQYGDFAVWQEKWLQSDGLKRQLDYWARQLAGLPLLEVPTDRPRPPVQTFNGNIESVLLPRELTDRVESLGSREKVTSFTVMLAAFQMLLRRHCGRDDVFVGTALARRASVKLEPVIGLFINPLVLRTDLSGDPSFLDLLARVRETVLGAFANQDVPFERVVDAVQPKRDPSRHPVFQVNFLFQRDFVQPFSASGLTLTAIPSVSPGAIYDLNFFLVERAEGWRASCEYNTDLYDLGTIRRLLGQFQSLLEGVTADPGRRLSEFLPPPADRPDQPAAGPAASYVAPRDAVEAQLAQLWEKVLGVTGVSVTADFFDVGGHSLLAARLLARVEKAFGNRLSLAALLQSPTIESLATRIRLGGPASGEGGPWTDGQGHGEDKWFDPQEQVFPLRREGKRPPLFLVDAGPFHRPLVRRLASDQPVFGIALPRLSALPEHFTVRDIAANLVEALEKSGQLGGRYSLAGWSYAGVFAYEMTRQLQARGHGPASLVLFDTNSPDYLRGFRRWRKLPIRLYLLLVKWFYHFRKACRLPLGRAWQDFREGSRRFQPSVPAARLAPKDGPAAEGADPPDAFSWRWQYLTARDYQPQPCDAPMVLFRSAVLQRGWFRDPQLGWGKLARAGLKVYEMPGEHDTMFLEPVVQRLASLLNECL